MSYVTKVSVWFNSEGASPAVVITKLLEMGFTLVRGAYDFVYHHETNGDMSDADLINSILEISNALHETLAGFQVLYSLNTYPEDEGEDFVPIEDIDKELETTRRELEELESEIENE